MPSRLQAAVELYVLEQDRAAGDGDGDEVCARCERVALRR